MRTLETSTSPEKEVDELEVQLKGTTLQDDLPEVSFPTPQQHQGMPMTPMSEAPSTLFTPSAMSQATDQSVISQSEDDVQEISTPKDKLNSFLVARDVSPVRTSMQTPW